MNETYVQMATHIGLLNFSTLEWYDSDDGLVVWL